MASTDSPGITETARQLLRFNGLLHTKGSAQKDLLQASRDLWSCPSYAQDLSDSQLRDSYIDALFDIAEMFRNKPDYEVLSPYGFNKPPLPGSVISSMTIAALERAHSLDDGHIRAGRNSSAKEAAAFKLGKVFEKAACHNTAVFWFRRSLDLARSSGLNENLLANLHGLGRNLNTLSKHDEARPCYHEILQFLKNVPLVGKISGGLAHAAMYDLQHGDQARGEAIMRTLRADALQVHSAYFGSTRIALWFAAALHAFGMHYIATGRAPDAATLAHEVIDNADRFEKPKLVCEAMHGLAAKAYLDLGDLEAALGELAHVHDISATKLVGYDEYIEPGTLELWLDIARIHAARHRYQLAMNAYETLAYNLGALIVDRNFGNTTRLRTHWLGRMAFVVQEMASVWLDIANADTRQAFEAHVANALIQVKTNTFVAIEKSKGEGALSIAAEVFAANRRYAAAARLVVAGPDNVDAMLELEAALLQREQLERIDLPFAENQLVAPSLSQVANGFGRPLSIHFSPSAGLAATLKGGVTKLVENDTVFVDYSLISVQPPRDGRQGMPQGRRYLGIRVHEGGYRIGDLGDAMEIDAQCVSLIKACSAPGKRRSVRHLALEKSAAQQEEVKFDRLAGNLYGRLMAPFEPLARKLTLSPDGMLAALPFQALLRADRWLAEETQVTYCHSLQFREGLFARQYNPATRRLPPAKKVAVVLGNPNYEGSGLAPLPGTKQEVSAVAKLLTEARSQDGENVFDEVRVHTGRDATVSRLLGGTLPRVIHIAAHGGFETKPFELAREPSTRFGEYYRVWDEMGASPMMALDDGLLRCALRLAKDPKAVHDEAGGTILTALELSSLTLLGCHLVILSACETGVGVPLYGTGALGFQYAAQAACARAALVSLWKVSDHGTALWMADFYKEYVRTLPGGEVSAAYLTALRQHCRRDGKRVDPYGWAAFVLIDNEYQNPMPW